MNEDRCFTPDSLQEGAGSFPAVHKQLGFSLKSFALLDLVGFDVKT